MSEWNNKIIGANLLFTFAGYVAAVAFQWQHVNHMIFNPIFVSLGLIAFNLGLGILAKLLDMMFRSEGVTMDELSRACLIGLGLQLLITFPFYMVYMNIV